MHFAHFCLVMLVTPLGSVASTLCPLQPDHAAAVNWACARAQLRDFDTRSYFWKTWCWTNLPWSNLLLWWIFPVHWQRLVRKRQWVASEALLWRHCGRGAAAGGDGERGPQGPQLLSRELLCPTCVNSQVRSSSWKIVNNGSDFIGLLLFRVRRSREELRFHLGTGRWKGMLEDGQQMLWSSLPSEALSFGLLLLQLNPTSLKYIYSVFISVVKSKGSITNIQHWSSEQPCLCNQVPRYRYSD